jgi:hypothetical protein
MSSWCSAISSSVLSMPSLCSALRRIRSSVIGTPSRFGGSLAADDEEPAAPALALRCSFASARPFFCLRRSRLRAASSAASSSSSISGSSLISSSSSM